MLGNNLAFLSKLSNDRLIILPTHKFVTTSLKTTTQLKKEEKYG